MRLGKLVKQGRFLFLNTLTYIKFDDAGRQQSIRQHLTTLFSPRLTRKPRQRLLAGAHLINRVIPFESYLDSHLITFDGLPFDFTDHAPQFLDSGSGHNVYWLRLNEHPMVLKIGYNSYGMKLPELVKRAIRIRCSHQMLSEWFQDVPGFIPDEQILIVQGPLRGYAAIGILQPYLENMRGIFEDHSEAAFVDLLHKNQPLRDQFRTVVETLNTVYHERHMCIDLLGDGNLVIIDRNGEDALCYIDPNKVIMIEELAPRIRDQYAERMAHRNRLLAASSDS